MSEHSQAAKAAKIPSNGTLHSAKVHDLDTNTRVAVPVALTVGVQAHLLEDAGKKERPRYKVMVIDGKMVTVAPLRSGRPITEKSRIVKARDVQPVKYVTQREAREQYHWKGFSEGFDNPEEFSLGEKAAAAALLAAVAKYGWRGGKVLWKMIQDHRNKVVEGSIAPEADIAPPPPPAAS